MDQHVQAVAGQVEQVVGLISSSPRLISVAESTEIFGHIDHLGWATAWAGVTPARRARSQPRNGPHDAAGQSD